MARAQIVRLSSKGQLVIPAPLRHALGLKTGQALTVRAGARREIVLSPAEDDEHDVETLLHRARAWSRRRDRDLVDELHARRSTERVRERRGG